MLKFTCEKTPLFSAVAVASRTVAQKSPISVLEGIHLRAEQDTLSLTGYDLENGITISLPAQVREAGECVLPPRLFFDIVRKAAEDEVSVTVDDQLKVEVKSGISVFRFSAESADDYPELPDVDEEEGVRIPQQDLRTMISGTLFSASENKTRPILTGCLFEVEENSVTTVAIDGVRLALRRWRTDETLHCAGKRFVAPASALREVEKLLADTEEPAEIVVGRKYIIFRIGDARLICRIIDGEFVDWRKVLNTAEEISLVANVSDLTSCLERVCLMISEKFNSPVRCLFSNNKACFSTATQTGAAQDNCSVAGDGKELTIGFNGTFLLDALRRISDDEVKLSLSNSLSPIVMTPAGDKDDFSYLILPMRMREATE
ncbi:MAG: DNA polymerase III subunit beta [Oscillospiraceae bacterium]|nr:DNA polymerase III subunit beta [Oscillospiraceae bacterium]